MNDTQLTILIILLSIVITAIDMSTDYKECYDAHPHVFLILFFHALIWVFSYIGCFYNNKKILIIYLLSFIAIPIHWLMNNNRCIVTEYVNKTCGFDINRKYDRILMLKNGVIYSIILKILCFSIALYRLQKM